MLVKTQVQWLLVQIQSQHMSSRASDRLYWSYILEISEGTYFPHDVEFFLVFFKCPTGPAGWGTANHLDYSYGDFVDAVQGEDLSKHLSASVKAAPARVKRHKLNVPMTDQKIKLIFNITGETSQNTELLCFLLFKNCVSKRFNKTSLAHMSLVKMQMAVLWTHLIAPFHHRLSS